ncbi:hypothetical protein VACV_TT11_039 [Vaccinia virus]|uniref:Uncharacterized protein n=2 Tax=Vaccinia virus TaxID=10245 RepID=M9WKE5_VACCV|nr:unknown [Vaccinia virus Tian Tan]AGJ91185.1 hypothetical protein VACV_TT8_039 [Vaccinia virus]AGJ92000.1 hypothetical protein VACV_TT11_039 [Vaccinia virus]
MGHIITYCQVHTNISILIRKAYHIIFFVIDCDCISLQFSNYVHHGNRFRTVLISKTSIACFSDIKRILPCTFKIYSINDCP